MNPAVTNYRRILSASTVRVQNSPMVCVRKEEYWDSSNPEDRKHRNIFVVEGTVKDKAQDYPIIWEFPCPDEMQSLVEGSLKPIGQLIEEVQRNSLPLGHLEVSTITTPWLTIGWTYNPDGTFSGFLRFTHSGMEVEAQMKDYRDLLSVRSLIMR
jgi:hypothetical protein